MKSSHRFGMLSIGLVLAAVTVAADPPDFPMRCHGSAGMASANGRRLTVTFRKGDRPAGQSVLPGQCSWLDRGLRPGEPTTIIDDRPSPGEARITANHINAGAIWTFWVFNTGPSLRATASASGTPIHKPQPID